METDPPVQGAANGENTKDSKPHDSEGWDGKLRVGRQAVITNPEALSDPDYSDENAPPAEEIEADEGV